MELDIDWEMKWKNRRWGFHSFLCMGISHVISRRTPGNVHGFSVIWYAKWCDRILCDQDQLGISCYSLWFNWYGHVFLATPPLFVDYSPVALLCTNKSIWAPLVSMGRDLYRGDLPYIHIYVSQLPAWIRYDGLMDFVGLCPFEFVDM